MEQKMYQFEALQNQDLPLNQKINLLFNNNLKDVINGQYSTSIQNAEGLFLTLREDSLLVELRGKGLRSVAMTLNKKGEFMTYTSQQRKYLEQNYGVKIEDVKKELDQILESMIRQLSPEGEKYHYWTVEEPLLTASETDKEIEKVGSGSSGGGVQKRIDSRRLQVLFDVVPDIIGQINESINLKLKNSGYVAYVCRDKLIFESETDGSAIYVVPLIDAIEGEIDDNVVSQLKPYLGHDRKWLREFGAQKKIHTKMDLNDDEYIQKATESLREFMDTDVLKITQEILAVNEEKNVAVNGN